MAVITEERAETGRRVAPVVSGRAAVHQRLRLVAASATALHLSVVGVVALLRAEPATSNILGAALLLGVAAVAWATFVARRRPSVLDVVDGAVLLVAAALLDDPGALEPVFVVALANATLYRGGRARAFLIGCYAVSLTGAIVLGDGASAGALLVQLPRLALVALVTGFLGDVAAATERTVRRERLLGAAGRELAGSDDVVRAGEIAALAAHDLARNAEVDGRLHAAVYVGDGDLLTLVAEAGESPTPTPELLDLRRLDGAVPADAGDGRLTAVLSGTSLAGSSHTDTVPGAPFAHVLWAPLFARDRLRGIIAVSLDTEPDTDLREAIEALGVDAVLVLDALESASHAESRARHVQTLLAHSIDAITVLDADHIIQFESSGPRLLGWATDELLGQHAGFLPHPDDVPYLGRALERIREVPGASVSCEWRARHRSGGWVQLETIITNLLHDDDVRGYLLNSRDITDRKLLEEQLEHQALHDPLTGLPNRTLFVDRVAHAIERAKRRQRRPAVCFIDLDGFKQVNDVYGHDVGDQLLAVVADRLRGSLREGDTPARYGGDRFTVLMEDMDESQVGVVANRILDVLCRPVMVDGRTLVVRATLGVATPQPLWTARELLQAAEAALVVAKEDGRGAWRRYDDSLPEPGEQDDLLIALDGALAADQLRLQYQPVVDLGTGEITAVEALLRWHHPERGVVPPNTFIPLAERTGAIVPIGLWVLETAAAQVRQWQEEHPGRRPLSVHVNVSAVQLADPGAVDDLGDAIARSGLDPASITLEITESALVADPISASTQLARLKSLGVRLAIDDFGVGYAGLGYLRQFAVDQLKIDKSFVDGLSGEGSTKLFEAMLGFSQAFKLDTVAEGVEDAEQAAVLGRLGCNGAQGFHFARPLDPDALEALLEGSADRGAEVA